METIVKLKRIVLLILFVLLIALTLTMNVSNIGSVGDISNKNNPAGIFAGHEQDAALFAGIYPVSEDNPFVIADFEELVFHLEYGTGIVVFGFPGCPRCKNAFPVLESAYNAMNMGRHAGFRGKIIYYDIFDDREADNERYREIVGFLEEFLPVDGNGNPRIYSPDVFFLAAGKVVGNHLDTVESLTDPSEPLNDEQRAELLEIYKKLIEKVEDCGC